MNSDTWLDQDHASPDKPGDWMNRNRRSVDGCVNTFNRLQSNSFLTQNSYSLDLDCR